MRRSLVVLLFVVAVVAAAVGGYVFASRQYGSDVPVAVREACATFERLNDAAAADAEAWSRENPDAAHPASASDVWTTGKQAELRAAVEGVSVEDLPQEWRAIPLTLGDLTSKMESTEDPEALPPSRVEQQDAFLAAEAACLGR